MLPRAMRRRSPISSGRIELAAVVLRSSSRQAFARYISLKGSPDTSARTYRFR